MLVFKDNLATIYEEIVKNYQETKTTVRILVACDVDSICAVRVLRSLFQTDQIPYKIIPMRSYQDLDRKRKEFQQAIQDESLNTMIFVNMGVMCDLEEVLFGADESNESGEADFDVDNYRMSLYVIDHHRPIHLQNVHSQGLVYVLCDDQDDNRREYPPAFIEDESDEEKEAQDEQDIDLDESDDEDVSSDEDGDRPRKRRRLNQRTDRQKERVSRRLQQERATKNYYSETYHVSHSTGITFQIARDLHKDDNDMLWCSILGLTCQFVNERISSDKYDDSIAVYQDEVRRRNQPFETGREQRAHRPRRRGSNQDLFADFEDVDDDGLDGFIEDDSMNGNGDDRQSSVGMFEGPNVTTLDMEARSDYTRELIENSKIVKHRAQNHVQFSTEFRFVLMRFWSLYESMLHSEFIATRLMVWNQQGRERLKVLLAKMAIPLIEAQQPYSTMKRDMKKKLPKVLQEHAADFDLDEELTYHSFTKRHGEHQSVSASDVVYALTSVIESDAVMEPERYRHRAVDDNEIWQNNFFYAFDALDLDVQNQTALDVGIKQAKTRQQCIIEMASMLLSKKLVQTTSLIRYVEINWKNRFQSPSILTKLALFLVEAIRESFKKKERMRVLQAKGMRGTDIEPKKFQEKPFFVASRNERHNTYIVAGIPAGSTFGDIRKSTFGIAFKEATDETGARVCQNSFEGSIIEVQSDDFKDWLESLHDHLGRPI